MSDDVHFDFGRLLVERTLNDTRIQTTNSSEARVVDMSGQLAQELDRPARLRWAR